MCAKLEEKYGEPVLVEKEPSSAAEAETQPNPEPPAHKPDDGVDPPPPPPPPPPAAVAESGPPAAAGEEAEAETEGSGGWGKRKADKLAAMRAKVAAAEAALRSEEDAKLAESFGGPST